MPLHLVREKPIIGPAALIRFQPPSGLASKSEELTLSISRPKCTQEQTSG